MIISNTGPSSRRKLVPLERGIDISTQTILFILLWYLIKKGSLWFHSESLRGTQIFYTGLQGNEKDRGRRAAADRTRLIRLRVKVITKSGFPQTECRSAESVPQLYSRPKVDRHGFTIYYVIFTRRDGQLPSQCTVVSLIRLWSLSRNCFDFNNFLRFGWCGFVIYSILFSLDKAPIYTLYWFPKWIWPLEWSSNKQ